jgi:hypothetical protein
MHRSRSHHAVIRVVDYAGNVIETHERKCNFVFASFTDCSRPFEVRVCSLQAAGAPVHLLLPLTGLTRAHRRARPQRAGIPPPHAEGDGLSGVTSDRESNAFVSGAAAFVGGVPLTRAMNPWAMPEAST